MSRGTKEREPKNQWHSFLSENTCIGVPVISLSMKIKENEARGGRIISVTQGLCGPPPRRRLMKILDFIHLDFRTRSKRNELGGDRLWRGHKAGFMTTLVILQGFGTIRDQAISVHDDVFFFTFLAWVYLQPTGRGCEESATVRIKTRKPRKYLVENRI